MSDHGEYRISNREPQNVEGADFDIRPSLFDILRFGKRARGISGYHGHDEDPWFQALIKLSYKRGDGALVRSDTAAPE